MMKEKVQARRKGTNKRFLIQCLAGLSVDVLRDAMAKQLSHSRWGEIYWLSYLPEGIAVAQKTLCTTSGLFRIIRDVNERKPPAICATSGV
jgi:hypothetical protein